MIRRLYRQIHYWPASGRGPSTLRKILLAWWYDCYVSLRAHVYCPDRIKLGRGVQSCGRSSLTFRSGTGTSRFNLTIGENTKIMPDVILVPEEGFIRIGCNWRHPVRELVLRGRRA